MASCALSWVRDPSVDFVNQIASKTAVRTAVEAIRLTKSTDGSITHDNAQLAIDELTNILDERLYYGENGVVGMGALLSAGSNALTSVTTTDMSNAASVLKASKKAAATIGAIVTRRPRSSIARMPTTRRTRRTWQSSTFSARRRGSPKG